MWDLVLQTGHGSRNPVAGEQQAGRHGPGPGSGPAPHGQGAAGVAPPPRFGCLYSRIEALVLATAPPPDRAWLERERKIPPATKTYDDPADRQPIYAQECRELHARMMAPGARYAHLARGLTVQQLAVRSSRDGQWIPVLQYLRQTPKETVETNHDVVVIYYHGGGLKVGEADSEDLSCRQLMHAFGSGGGGGSGGSAGRMTLYSVGYRLMPQHAASVCLMDAVDACQWVLARRGPSARVFVVGSSSGGQLAALVAQAAPRGTFAGVLLRCPVTSDAFSGCEYVPLRLRDAHTSADHPSFRTSLLGRMERAVPRDGLARMPLEADDATLVRQPRHWIQVCTNDTLYSDGVCYAMALAAAGVDVKVDVVVGWPHTFWLKFPELDRAWEADMEMLRGFKWLLSGGAAGGGAGGSGRRASDRGSEGDMDESEG